MIFPRKMSLVRIFVLKDFLDHLSQVLHNFGFIEIEKARNFVKEDGKLRNLDIHQLLSETQNLEERIKKVCHMLGIKPYKRKEVRVKISTKLVEDIEQRFKDLESSVLNIAAKIDFNNAKIEELDAKSEILGLIEDAGLNLDIFKNLKNIVVKLGYVPADVLDYLQKENLQDIIIDTRKRVHDKAYIFCLALREKEEQLLRILKSIKFREVSLPEESRRLKDILDELEFEIWQYREEIASYRHQLKKFRESYRDYLQESLVSLEENKKIYRAMDNFLASQTGYVVVGWVPSIFLKDLRRRFRDFEGYIHIEEELADSLIERGFALKDIPSFLGHKLLRPFEKMLKFYGIPAYRHIDPTLFMALSFIVMFGMMFADLGHGLILVFVGLSLAGFKRIADFCRILVCCGLSSSFFGILFGSSFGREDMITPLWFSPQAYPEKFLGIGIGVGVLMVSLGIGLNIIQNLKNRNVGKSLFSQWGLMSLFFYWVALYFVGGILRYRAFSVNAGTIFLILVAPLFIMSVGDFFFLKNVDFSEIIFKPAEVVLGLLTNTISFVRVAAFGMAHAALGGCVYIVAKNLGGLPGLKESVIVEGNIGVIILEGVIVFIQALRLEFYEFFSKFFHLQGREFRPLKQKEV